MIKIRRKKQEDLPEIKKQVPANVPNNYNYSGFGIADDNFDEIDSSYDNKQPFDTQQSFDTNQSFESSLYNELLSVLKIDDRTMQTIIRAITRSENETFKFVQSSGDYRIFYFSDSTNHIVPVTIKRIVEVRDVYLNMLSKGE